MLRKSRNDGVEDFELIPESKAIVFELSFESKRADSEIKWGLFELETKMDSKLDFSLHSK